MFGQVAALKLDHAEAHYEHGAALSRIGQFADAVARYDHAIALKPAYADAYYNRGNALQHLRQTAAAIASYDSAIALKPDLAQAYNARGLAFQASAQTDAALASFDDAIAIKPNFAEAHYNRGNLLREIHQFEAAIASYDHALAVVPDYAVAQWHKCLSLLTIGDLDRGLPLYEARWKRIPAKALKHRTWPQPMWLGQVSLAGKTILLHSEQGFGDTLQFCRYAKLVAATGARVIVQGPKTLVGVLRSLEGVSDVIAEGDPLLTFDVHCPLLSLPLAFKTTLATIPSPQPYLRPDPERVNAWAEKLGVKSKPRVGLVWSTGLYKSNIDRSIPLAALLPYLPPHREYISLQKEVRDADQPTLESCGVIRHFGQDLADFSDTAALCALMDVVISVDTSVVHLSGGRGQKTWVLVPYISDWRWFMERSDSPWYASATLHRQNADRAWQPVFEKIRAGLVSLG